MLKLMLFIPHGMNILRNKKNKQQQQNCDKQAVNALRAQHWMTSTTWIV